MKKIFFIESPLQLLNAYEAAHFFGCNSPQIYIRQSGDDLNDFQISNLVNILGLTEHVKFIQIKAKNKSIFDYLKIVFFKYYFKIKIKSYTQIFIGNHESGFLSQIIQSVDKRKLLLLDDGAKTIVIQSKFDDSFNIDFFSFYDLEAYNEQTIYTNSFASVKAKLNNTKHTEEILLLGSKLSEIGIITEEYYIKLVEKISRYYNHSPIIYIPHREEDTDKLKRIASKITNISIKKLDYPVEFYGLYELKIPKTITSFYSTALYTMSKIYGCVPTAFLFDYTNYPNKRNIDKVYEYYKKEMKVVDIK